MLDNLGRALQEAKFYRALRYPTGVGWLGCLGLGDLGDVCLCL